MKGKIEHSTTYTHLAELAFAVVYFELLCYVVLFASLTFLRVAIFATAVIIHFPAFLVQHWSMTVRALRGSIDIGAMKDGVVYVLQQPWWHRGETEIEKPRADCDRRIFNGERLSSGEGELFCGRRWSTRRSSRSSLVTIAQRTKGL